MKLGTLMCFGPRINFIRDIKKKLLIFKIFKIDYLNGKKMEFSKIQN